MTAVVSNDTEGAHRLILIGVPHVPVDTIVPSGKLSGLNGIARVILVDPVVVSPDEVYAVVAFGEVPGVFGHSCPLHVSVDDDSVEGTKCPKDRVKQIAFPFLEEGSVLRGEPRVCRVWSFPAAPGGDPVAHLICDPFQLILVAITVTRWPLLR